MIYIELGDLAADSYQRLIDESVGDGDNTIEKNEKRAVELAKTYMEKRYDTELIFGTPTIRNEILVDIISKITLAKVLGRNAARKLPSDIKEDMDWAIKMLEKINAGTLTLDLPKPTDNNGNAISMSIWGNSTNSNNYI